MLGGFYIMKMKSDHFPGLLELCLGQWLVSPFANKSHLTVRRAPNSWTRPPAMTYVNVPMLRLLILGNIGTFKRWKRETLWCDLKEDLGLQSFSFTFFCFMAAQWADFLYPAPTMTCDLPTGSKAMCQSQTEASKTVLPKYTIFFFVSWLSQIFLIGTSNWLTHLLNYSREKTWESIF